MEHKKVTIEELRTFEGLESLSDQEADEVIESLFELSLIIFNAITK